LIAILDAAYSKTSSVAACVTAAGWEASRPLHEIAFQAGEPAAYEPGQFYKRELPLLLGVLAKLPRTPDIIVIDGYVWLGDGRPGLGARLYEALEESCAVVGVAKTAFAGAVNWSEPVLRGASTSPLFVTAAGITRSQAANGVARMHGKNRLPTLVRLADRLARQAV
jgi:deoxyribonuclease V